MNRIARMTSDLPNADSALAGYSRLAALLRQHLPSRIANLYAQPKSGDGQAIDWYSELNGQPQALSALSPVAAENVRHHLNEKLMAVRQLAEKLAAESGQDHPDVLLLRQAAHLPDDANVYDLDGQPIITCWGKSPTVAPVIPPTALAATALSGSAWRRWWPLWLLLLLLLMLLAGWWFWWRVPTPPPVVTPVAMIAPPKTPEAEKVVEPPKAPEPEKVVEPPKAPEPEKVAKPEPVKIAEQPKVPVVVAEKPVIPVPVKPKNLTPIDRCIAEETEAGRASQAAEHCKAKLGSNIKSMCPADRPPELAPQMVVVLDASGSMNISMDITRQEMAWAERFQKLMPEMTREPRRISLARTSISNIIEQLPSDMSIGLVTAEDCNLVKSRGFFPASQRSQLIHQVNSTEPYRATPLAQALNVGGQMLDGVTRDAILLLVSDGAETCGGDPCAMARELKRRKPRLVVNVVDIMGAGAGNCVANATGGKVFTAKNSADFSKAMNKAVESYIPKNCAP